MKRLCSYYARPFLFLFLLLTSNVLLQAQGKPNENGDDPPRIVTSNWSNYMDTEGCVVLDADGQLEIHVVVNVGVSDVSGFPPMYYQFEFDGFTDFQGPITNFDPVIYNDNIVYYQARFPYKIPYEAACLADPTAIIPIDYTITLLTPDGNGGYENYPIADHLTSLFPLFLVENESGTIETVPVFTGTKNLCCGYNPLEDPQFRAVQNSETSVSISPNPFSEMIRLKYYQAKKGNLKIELFDSTGKIWKQMNFKGVEAGWMDLQIPTAELAPGFYYFRVNDDQVFKTVKLSTQ
ncbi:MAG: T9SS type A sorting domain-containing protein [Saprospiraceae bacterium]